MGINTLSNTVEADAGLDFIKSIAREVKGLDIGDPKIKFDDIRNKDRYNLDEKEKIYIDKLARNFKDAMGEIDTNKRQKDGALVLLKIMAGIQTNIHDNIVRMDLLSIYFEKINKKEFKNMLVSSLANDFFYSKYDPELLDKSNDLNAIMKKFIKNNDISFAFDNKTYSEDDAVVINDIRDGLSKTGIGAKYDIKDDIITDFQINKKDLMKEILREYTNKNLENPNLKQDIILFMICKSTKFIESSLKFNDNVSNDDKEHEYEKRYTELWNVMKKGPLTLYYRNILSAMSKKYKLTNYITEFENK